MTARMDGGISNDHDDLKNQPIKEQPPFGAEATEYRSQRLKLEEKVRDALILRRTQELAELYTDPEIQNMLQKTLEETMLAAMGSDIENELDHEELDELKEAIAESIEATFSNTSARITAAAKQAANEYQTLAEYEQLFQTEIVDQINEHGEPLDADALADFRAANAIFADTYAEREQIISRLTDIAETEGVEAATSEQSFNNILKEFYPTASDFEKRIEYAKNIIQEYVDTISRALSKCGEYGETLSNTIVTLIRSANEQSQHIRERELPKQIKKIYG